MSEFSFTEANLKQAQKIIGRYPANKEKSAIMPLLYLAQKQNNNWVSKEVMNYIAKFLNIEPMQVYEVATFYTMYNKQPVGKYLIQICRTTPCWLCGCDDILRACTDILGIKVGETTVDKKFTIIEVECIGACTGGPAIQINDHFYEKLNYIKMKKLLEELMSEN